MKDGYIKLHRGMLRWGWYDDPDTFRVFIDILLNVSHTKCEYHGIKLEAGQGIFGRKKIAKRLKISERSVRTALEHLKMTNEILIESTNRFSIITVKNWQKYQFSEEKMAANKSTNKSTNKKIAESTINKELEQGEKSKSTNKTTNKTTNNRPTTDQQPTNKTQKNSKKSTNKTTNKTTNKNEIVYNVKMEKDPKIDHIQEERRKKYINIYIVEQLVNYLNQKTNSNYKPDSKQTIQYISDLLSNGFTEQDVKLVIDTKTEEWIGSDFEKYLRPSTLFGSKFEGYLNAAQRRDNVKVKSKEKINSQIANLENTINSLSEKIKTADKDQRQEIKLQIEWNKEALKKAQLKLNEL